MQSFLIRCEIQSFLRQESKRTYKREEWKIRCRGGAGEGGEGRKAAKRGNTIFKLKPVWALVKSTGLKEVGLQGDQLLSIWTRHGKGGKVARPPEPRASSQTMCSFQSRPRDTVLTDACCCMRLLPEFGEFAPRSSHLCGMCFIHWLISWPRAANILYENVNNL